jgi:DedD protein
MLSMKKRLTGAIILVALVVIFVPMLLEEKTSRIELGPLIPEQPQESFSTTLIPNESVTTIAKPVEPEEARRYELPVGEVMEQPAGSGLSNEIMVPTEVVKVNDPTPVQATAPEKQQQQAETSGAQPVKTPPLQGKVVTEGWVIQAGSFGQSSNADELKKRLIASGRAAFIEPVEVKGKMLYRVRVGPLEKRAEADRQLAIIEKEFQLKGKVVSFP